MATKRSQKKYPALDPHLNPRTRYDQNDYDYLDKLSPENKQYLNNFTAEWLHADFSGERIHPVIIEKKYIKTKRRYKKVDKYKKDSGDRNNARNADVLSRSKAKGSYVAFEDISSNDETLDNFEDRLISQLDSKEED